MSRANLPMVATQRFIGYYNRNGCALIFLKPIPGSEDMLVTHMVTHSFRDPAAWKGPSYRPDLGRTYKGEPKEDSDE